MSVPLATLPATPLNLSMAPVLGGAVPLTAAVSLTTPTSATVITGLTIPITIPSVASYVRVEVCGKGVTISAAATITIGCYLGATANALTTLIGTQVRLGATGGTVCDINGVFFLPVTSALAGTSTNISIAATASTGNFVTQASSTEPTFLIVTVI